MTTSGTLPFFGMADLSIMKTFTPKERFEMLKHVLHRSPSFSIEHLYQIDNTLTDFLSNSENAKLITTKKASIEIQRRLNVDFGMSDSNELMRAINHAFDWLVEGGYLNEVHLN